MDFYISDTVISWLLIGGASVCSFMIAKAWYDPHKISGITIEFLYEQGYVRGHRDEDGTLHLKKINE